MSELWRFHLNLQFNDGKCWYTQNWTQIEKHPGKTASRHNYTQRIAPRQNCTHPILKSEIWVKTCHLFQLDLLNCSSIGGNFWIWYRGGRGGGGLPRTAKNFAGEGGVNSKFIWGNLNTTPFPFMPWWLIYQKLQSICNYNYLKDVY